jgi:hypothetical protein
MLNCFQLRFSPQATHYFRDCCTSVGLKALNFVTYAKHRYHTLYDVLDRILYLKKVSRKLLYHSV